MESKEKLFCFRIEWYKCTILTLIFKLEICRHFFDYQITITSIFFTPITAFFQREKKVYSLKNIRKYLNNVKHNTSRRVQ